MRAERAVRGFAPPVRVDDRRVHGIPARGTAGHASGGGRRAAARQESGVLDVELVKAKDGVPGADPHVGADLEGGVKVHVAARGGQSGRGGQPSLAGRGRARRARAHPQAAARSETRQQNERQLGSSRPRKSHSAMEMASGVEARKTMKVSTCGRARPGLAHGHGRGGAEGGRAARWRTAASLCLRRRRRGRRPQWGGRRAACSTPARPPR